VGFICHMLVRRANYDCLPALHVYKVWESTGRFISAEPCAFPEIKLLQCKRYTEKSTD
jgi:hypothetical protein